MSTVNYAANEQGMKEPDTAETGLKSDAGLSTPNGQKTTNLDASANSNQPTPLISAIWEDKKESRNLKKVLSASGALTTIANASQFSYTPGTSLLVIDFDSVGAELENIFEQLSSEEKQPAVLVVSATRNKDDLLRLFSSSVPINLVAKNISLDPSELFVTVQKLLNQDIFGLTKYLTWGVRPHDCIITGSTQKGTVVSDLTHYLCEIGCNKRLQALIQGVADEFIMNAVYNAPVDENGHPKYATQDRTIPVHLSRNEYVGFSYAFDGKRFAISVSDNFGRLDRQTIRKYIQKCLAGGHDQIDQKDGGAGLGLYHAFESLNQLVVNVSPQKRTEMLGIIDISGSYKDFAIKPKSLNIFVEGEGD